MYQMLEAGDVWGSAFLGVKDNIHLGSVGGLSRTMRIMMASTQCAAISWNNTLLRTSFVHVRRFNHLL